MTKRRLLIGAFAVAVLATGGLAFAQTGDGEPEPTTTEGGEGEVEVRQRAELSGPEQVAEAEQIQTRGTQLSRRIAAMLDEARRERDIIRVTCLNDKLTQVNANLRTLTERMENLSQAVQAQDTSRRNHEYTVVTVLGQKFSTLEQEANQCIGQDLYETGATRVTTTIDPSTPDEDPTVDYAIEPPPMEVAAPFIPPPCSPCI
jgi:hypothetical protein